MGSLGFNGLFRTPPFFKSCVDKLLRNAKPSRPLRLRQRQSINFNENARSPVVSLLGARRPSAVAGLVISIVVNAINAGPFGSRPHVLNKCLK